jgi:hypothetical protein
MNGGRGRAIALPSLASALEGMGGQSHVPAALTQEDLSYPLHRELRMPQGRSKQGWRR